MVRYWSEYVTKYSNALNLEISVFTFDDPKKIARSLEWTIRALELV